MTDFLNIQPLNIQPRNVKTLKVPEINQHFKVRLTASDANWLRFGNPEWRMTEVQRLCDKVYSAVLGLMNESKRAMKAKEKPMAKHVYCTHRPQMRQTHKAVGHSSQRKSSQLWRENLRSTLPPQNRDGCDLYLYDVLEGRRMTFSLARTSVKRLRNCKSRKFTVRKLVAQLNLLDYRNPMSHRKFWY